MVTRSMRAEWKEMMRRSWSPRQWFEEDDPPEAPYSIFGDELMWVYRTKAGGRGWEVGYFDPTKAWNWESDHSTANSAALRVHWLNGGKQRDHDGPKEPGRRAT